MCQTTKNMLKYSNSFTLYLETIPHTNLLILPLANSVKNLTKLKLNIIPRLIYYIVEEILMLGKGLALPRLA